MSGAPTLGVDLLGDPNSRAAKLALTDRIADLEHLNISLADSRDAWKALAQTNARLANCTETLCRAQGVEIDELWRLTDQSLEAMQRILGGKPSDTLVRDAVIAIQHLKARESGLSSTQMRGSETSLKAE